MYVEAKCLELKGTNYEIGNTIGNMISAIPGIKAMIAAGPELSGSDAAQAKNLFELWCPGLNEEVQGLADALGAKPGKIAFYAMTYLRPACSQLAVMPEKTDNGHVLLARSYEFSPQFEDFTLARTCVKGKYAHIGSTVMILGRDEGLNEQGLGVTMSSCGFPVGTPENMRRPAIRGLQFWAVIRTILENCKDVEEALLFVKDMPIAYNINMILADAKGSMALVETLEGDKAVKRGDAEAFLHATNHALMPELKQREKNAMINSLKRYETIGQFLNGAERINAEQIKSLLLREYPEGLSCRDYAGFFGTTKSIVMDISDLRLDICWGGLEENGWQSYSVREPLPDGTRKVKLIEKEACPGFYDMITV